MCGIYKITNIINGKIYIGKSQNIYSRWEYHKTMYNSAKESNKALYQAFQKYGLNNFLFEVIEEMTYENYELFSNNREQYWILYYNSYKNGYNNTLGGDGGYIEAAAAANRKLTLEEVSQIRDLYADCELCLDEAYRLFQHKITRRGFQAVWLGENYKRIKPEVFTEENKKRHSLIEHQRQGKLRKGKKYK